MKRVNSTVLLTLLGIGGLAFVLGKKTAATAAPAKTAVPGNAVGVGTKAPGTLGLPSQIPNMVPIAGAVPYPADESLQESIDEMQAAGVGSTPLKRLTRVS